MKGRDTLARCTRTFKNLQATVPGVPLDITRRFRRTVLLLSGSNGADTIDVGPEAPETNY